MSDAKTKMEFTIENREALLALCQTKAVSIYTEIELKKEIKRIAHKINAALVGEMEYPSLFAAQYCADQILSALIEFR